MARISINGFESGWGTSTEALDGGSSSGSSSTGPVTLDTVKVRTTGPSQGAALCDSGAGNTVAWIREAPTDQANGDLGFKPANGTSVFARRYLSWRDLPSSTVAVMQVSDGGGLFASARLTSAGKLQLWIDGGNGLQTGSDSALTIVADDTTWYRLEMLALCDPGGGNDTFELRLNGVTVASDSSQNVFNGYGNGFRCWAGWINAPGANKRVSVDDGAINDSTGAAQNSWCGDGNVVYSRPVSDSSRTGWTAGAGGTTNLFSGVDNIPPKGNPTPADTDEIKDLANNTTDAVTFNMQDYLTAGVPSTATVVAIQPIIEVASNNAAGQMSWGEQIASNPVGSETVMSGLTAPGAFHFWPTFWAPLRGASISSPSVVLGTQPTFTVRKATADATNTQAVDMVAIAIEYIPSTAGDSTFSGPVDQSGIVGSAWPGKVSSPASAGSAFHS